MKRIVLLLLVSLIAMSTMDLRRENSAAAVDLMAQLQRTAERIGPIDGQLAGVTPTRRTQLDEIRALQELYRLADFSAARRIRRVIRALWNEQSALTKARVQAPGS